MTDSHSKEILAKHLERSHQLWALFQKRGIAEKTQLRLELFSYKAPNRGAAKAMCVLIQEQTDYAVRVESSGSFFHRKWRVEGTTQKTADSQEALDQWLTWMVMAGKERDCEFDLWGPEL